MNKLAIHPRTKDKLENILASPFHGLLFIGKEGIGKKTLAISTVESILAVDNFTNYPYGLLVESEDGNAIGIDKIRSIEHFLSLKVLSKKSINRAVIIDRADQLSIAAQNALLKTLEEPPKGSIIALTANHEHSLLPTIRSRLQIINVALPPIEILKDTFADTDSETFIKAYNISGGSPGSLSKIIKDNDHPLLMATDLARAILAKTTYERLLMVDELYKNKEVILDVLFILQQMSNIKLQTVTGSATKTWKNILDVSYQAEQAISKNAQLKLVLINLMLNI